jgi:NADPH:quinone reductase-like Zn-dependent oxidoreductase
MAFEPVRFPTRYLIFNGITLKGFWMDKWYKDNSEARAKIMFDKLFYLMKEGFVTPLIEANFSLDDFHAAITAAQQPRLGKILLTT